MIEVIPAAVVNPHGRRDVIGNAENTYAELVGEPRTQRQPCFAVLLHIINIPFQIAVAVPHHLEAEPRISYGRIGGGEHVLYPCAVVAVGKHPAFGVARRVVADTHAHERGGTVIDASEHDLLLIARR